MKSNPLATVLISILLTSSIAASASAGDVAIRAGKIYTGDGSVIENGIVLVSDGKITAVGAGILIPNETETIDLPDGAVTPGLIDAYSTPGMSQSASWAEHESEVIPHLKTLDAWDLTHEDFRRLARDGVTTVFLAGDPSSVIGSQGAVVKTGIGGKDRVLVAATQPMASLSSESYSRGVRNNTPFGRAQTFRTRRPTTGMGINWVFREAFHTAARNAWGNERDEVPPPSHDALVSVLEGKNPLRVLARRRHDIYTAMRLTREFGLESFTLIEATEAYRCADDIADAGIPVVFGPMMTSPRGQWRQRSFEANRASLGTPRILHEAGVTFALTAADIFNETSLAEQATFAIRYGLPVEAAVRATTSTPADMLGVADHVGTIATGKQADIVVWSGEPFDALSDIHTVLLDGKIVHKGFGWQQQ